jgi:type IV pilus assembly protein PilC
MPRYIYTAKSQPNQNIQGDIEAESEQDAINKLTKMGYFPVSVQTQGASLNKQNIWYFRKIAKREIVIFTRQLSSLTESGVNIIKSLNILSNQSNNKSLKIILNGLISKIQDGQSLSESLSGYPNLFSGLYISMVHSGEVGGNIELTLKRLADFLEKEEEFRSSIRQALVYPFFILAVSALTVIILLGFVIPRLVSMFEDMGQILPLPTQMLINLSAFLRSYWLAILAIILISIFLLRRIYLSPQGKAWLDRLKLRLGIWGIIVLKTEIGRFARTLSLLLSSGIPTLHSLDISALVLENQILKLEVQKFKNQIAGGLSFSKCLQESKLFPAFVTDIARIGEETGTLEKSLMRIADSYEAETDRTLKALTRLLEPVIILVMGLIVGFIVLSMLLPIFQINLIVR